jgi:hypothetical protein
MNCGGDAGRVAGRVAGNGWIVFGNGQPSSAESYREKRARGRKENIPGRGRKQDSSSRRRGKLGLLVTVFFCTVMATAISEARVVLVAFIDKLRRRVARRHWGPGIEEFANVHAS